MQKVNLGSRNGNKDSEKVNHEFRYIHQCYNLHSKAKVAKTPYAEYQRYEHEIKYLKSQYRYYNTATKCVPKFNSKDIYKVNYEKYTFGYKKKKNKLIHFPLMQYKEYWKQKSYAYVKVNIRNVPNPNKEQELDELTHYKEIILEKNNIISYHATYINSLYYDYIYQGCNLGQFQLFKTNDRIFGSIERVMPDDRISNKDNGASYERKSVSVERYDPEKINLLEQNIAFLKKQNELLTNTKDSLLKKLEQHVKLMALKDQETLYIKTKCDRVSAQLNTLSTTYKAKRTAEKSVCTTESNAGPRGNSNIKKELDELFDLLKVYPQLGHLQTYIHDFNTTTFNFLMKSICDLNNFGKNNSTKNNNIFRRKYMPPNSDNRDDVDRVSDSYSSNAHEKPKLSDSSHVSVSSNLSQKLSYSSKLHIRTDLVHNYSEEEDSGQKSSKFNNDTNANTLLEVKTQPSDRSLNHRTTKGVFAYKSPKSDVNLSGFKKIAIKVNEESPFTLGAKSPKRKLTSQLDKLDLDNPQSKTQRLTSGEITTSSSTHASATKLSGRDSGPKVKLVCTQERKYASNARVLQNKKKMVDHSSNFLVQQSMKDIYLSRTDSKHAKGPSCNKPTTDKEPSTKSNHSTSKKQKNEIIDKMMLKLNDISKSMKKHVKKMEYLSERIE